MWNFMTEGKGFCRRRQERKAQEQVKRDRKLRQNRSHRKQKQTKKAITTIAHAL